MENPIKMDDLGGKTPIFGSTPIYTHVCFKRTFFLGNAIFSGMSAKLRGRGLEHQFSTGVKTSVAHSKWSPRRVDFQWQPFGCLVFFPSPLDLWWSLVVHYWKCIVAYKFDELPKKKHKNKKKEIQVRTGWVICTWQFCDRALFGMVSSRDPSKGESWPPTRG